MPWRCESTAIAAGIQAAALLDGARGQMLGAAMLGHGAALLEGERFAQRGVADGISGDARQHRGAQAGAVPTGKRVIGEFVDMGARCHHTPFAANQFVGNGAPAAWLQTPFGHILFCAHRSGGDAVVELRAFHGFGLLFSSSVLFFQTASKVYLHQQR